MTDRFVVAVALALAAAAPSARAAEPVMVQCGREYQAAKAAGTLNGLDWAGYRAACAARLKATPASAAAPAAVAPPAAAAAVPPASAPAAKASSPASDGRAAMHARQKQCGAEWRADKVALLAKTPGLTWPKYWSQCNARLKAAGG